MGHPDKHAGSGDIKHEQLSYAVVGAAMDVHNKLGPGWDEYDYHRALLQTIQGKGIKAASKLHGYVKQSNLIADEFELDIIVEDSIILELKDVHASFAPAHYLQLINYLKFWNCDLGLLINFGLERLPYQRIPFTPVSGGILFTDLWNAYETIHKDTADILSSVFKSILSAHGLGYSSNVYKRIFSAECKVRQLPVDLPAIEPVYDDIALGSRPTDAFCFGGHTLILISALAEDASPVDTKRMYSYLTQADLSFGVTVNFGKSNLNIRLIQRS